MRHNAAPRSTAALVGGIVLSTVAALVSALQRSGVRP